MFGITRRMGAAVTAALVLLFILLLLGLAGRAAADSSPKKTPVKIAARYRVVDAGPALTEPRILDDGRIVGTIQDAETHISAGWESLRGKHRHQILVPAPNVIINGVEKKTYVGYHMGTDEDGMFAGRAFIWKDSVYSEPIDADHSSAIAIKNGVIIGELRATPFGDTQSFVIDRGGAVTTLPVSTSLLAINANGDAVGTRFVDWGWGVRIYRRSADGTETEFGDGVAYAINSKGSIVGYTYTGDGATPCLIRPGSTVIEHLEPTNYRGAALAINPKGLVVGNLGDGGDAHPFRAFGWSQATGLVDLNSRISPAAAARWVLRAAESININGEIVGHGWLNGQPRTFLLIPR